MRLSICLVAIIVLGLSSTTTSNSALTFEQAAGDDTKLVYADFEKVENGRAVSNGGGQIQIYTGQESTPVKFKGIAGASPGAPEIVRLPNNETNHLASFEYSLTGPNQWANVTLEIQGKPATNGQTVADDVSGFKNLSMQLYATGIDSVRVEVISHGQGIKLDAGFPQMAIKLKPGLNTYLIPLNKLAQPGWQQQKVDSKEVLKKLTAVTISAFCGGQCTPQNGQIVIDNIMFQK
jgi:hypothetical protein